MSSYWSRHKFFILASLIYIIPGVAFEMVFFASYRSEGPIVTGALDLMLLIFVILFFIGMILAFPAVCLYGRHDLLIVIVPYYVVAYGILYLLWRRSKKIKPTEHALV